MSALQSMPLAALRQLTDQDSDEFLLGPNGQSGAPPAAGNPLLAALMSGAGNAPPSLGPTAPSLGPNGQGPPGAVGGASALSPLAQSIMGGSAPVPPSQFMNAASQPAAPPVNPAVARQHALWLAIQQEKAAQQARNSVGTPGATQFAAAAPLTSSRANSLVQSFLDGGSAGAPSGGAPNSLGAPGAGAAPPMPPAPTPGPPQLGPSPGINGPAPAQPSPAPSSVDSQLAKLTALGSPNNPLAVRLHKRFLEEEAAAQAQSELKQAALGVDPMTGKPMIGGAYDPSRPGPYGFDPNVIAGAIPQGNVDVKALDDKRKTSDANFLNPDFAKRFAGGGPVIDDRGPLLRSIVDPSSIALPAYRVKRAAQEEPKDIAKLPPDLRRAILGRDADAARDKKFDELAEAEGKTWHGNVAMTDDEWKAATERQAARDNEKATKRAGRAMERREREDSLAKSIAANTANNPFAGMSPEQMQMAMWNPEAMRVMSQAQQGNLDRQNRIEVARVQAGHNDPRWMAENTRKDAQSALEFARGKLADPNTPAREKPYWKQQADDAAAKMSGVAKFTPPPGPPAQSIAQKVQHMSPLAKAMMFLTPGLGFFGNAARNFLTSTGE